MSSLSTALKSSIFFFSSRRRHTRFDCDWSSDVCSSDLKYDTNPTRGIDVAVGSLFTWLRTNRWFATSLKTPDDYRAWRSGRNALLRSSPFDARDYYYGLQAWATFSVGDTPGFGGDAKAALASIKAH